MYVKGHSMIHGPILPPVTVKLDLYSRTTAAASWGIHAMPYLIFFFGGGAGA